MTAADETDDGREQAAVDNGLGRQPQRPDGGRESTQEDVAKRHRILRSLRKQLERHPAIISARGSPDGQYAALAADVDPAQFERNSDSASLRVTWQPNPHLPPATSLDDRRRTSLTSNFKIHYSESSGFDCGVHLEPNPHVDGHLHYQERASPTDEYDYDDVSLAATAPVGVLWETLELIADRLQHA
ncbi:hypothetical protein [Halobacterium noricense]|jgi:hypothetical protein|uniref:hypothetical protein n=1 Tax=Halobacterium noricense TaxID=223182 RepID=UPI001E4E3D6F|nr:hypothetical protein [Halobacterium noricense]UHH26602.1 hypothetical protein LT974_06615 [Halobacterium noricense]